MPAANVTPDIVTFTTLMYNCAENHLLAQAYSVRTEMGTVCIFLDVYTTQLYVSFHIYMSLLFVSFDVCMSLLFGLFCGHF